MVEVTDILITIMEGITTMHLGFIITTTLLIALLFMYGLIKDAIALIIFVLSCNTTGCYSYRNHSLMLYYLHILYNRLIIIMDNCKKNII